MTSRDSSDDEARSCFRGSNVVHIPDLAPITFRNPSYEAGKIVGNYIKVSVHDILENNFKNMYGILIDFVVRVRDTCLKFRVGVYGSLSSATQ